MRQSPKSVGVWMLRTLTVFVAGPVAPLMTQRRSQLAVSHDGTGSCMSAPLVIAFVGARLLRVVEEERVVGCKRVRGAGRFVRVEDLRRRLRRHRRDRCGGV